MAYELDQLAPLENRMLRHSYHLPDNSKPGNFFLLRGRFNTFLFEENDGYGTLYPAFEKKVEEPMQELLKALLKKHCSSLSLFGYEAPVLEGTPFNYESIDTTVRIFQTPLPAEEYEARLAKFWRAGFGYRELEEKDVPAIVDLVSRWVEEKRASLRKTYGTISFDAGDTGEVEGKIHELKLIRNELMGLDAALEKGAYYQTILLQPLSRFYGAFRGGSLVAYIETEGNNTFQSFNSRSSIRMNSYSPQEFLDLQVALEFVRKGVQRFERGVLNKRVMIEGLMRYKEKFGPLQIVTEKDYEDIEL